MPLKRVSQRYVIATSKTVDVAKVDLKDVDDSLFAAKAEREAKSKALKKGVTPERLEMYEKLFRAQKKKKKNDRGKSVVS